MGATRGEESGWGGGGCYCRYSSCAIMQRGEGCIAGLHKGDSRIDAEGEASLQGHGCRDAALALLQQQASKQASIECRRLQARTP